MNSVISFAVFCLCVFSVGCNIYQVHQIIERAGYVAETHHVTTSDGYILEMHRIPFRRGEASGKEGRPVVFLMHGLMGASVHYITLGREYAIAYNLADAGYDVWMGNARGNRNSRRHVTLNPDARDTRVQFFDFTWHEIAVIDVPTMIDYVLEQTEQPQLHYIGHSQGGTVFLVLTSTLTEYNNKIASAHLLAGVGYKDHFPQPILRLLSRFVDPIWGVARSIGLVELFPPSFLFPKSNEKKKEIWEYCFGDPKYRDLCELAGVKEFMKSAYNTSLKHVTYNDGASEEVMAFSLGLGGASLKQFGHYGQNIQDSIFRRWNFGVAENIQQYGTADPPIYNISLITVNVTMHYTVSDVLLDQRDVYAMEADMPYTVSRRVARETFGHADFVAANDVKELVTVYIIDAIADVHAGNMNATNVEPEPVIDITDASSTVVLSFIAKMYLIIYSLYCIIY